MALVRPAFIWVFLASATLISNSQGQTTDTVESTTTTLTSTSTNSASKSTPVPDRPVKEPGCYWTPCKSPLTYDLKCPLDTEEQNENDEMPCEGIFLKYQCCPRKDYTTTTTVKPAEITKGVEKVIPTPI